MAVRHQSREQEVQVVLGKLNNELLINLSIRAVQFCSEVHAAVAYAEGTEHPLLKACKEHNLKVTFYGLLDEEGAVGVPLLKELLSWGPSRAEVHLVKGNYHPKVVWWRGFGAYVGSANLTHNGWFNNIEAGVFLDEAELSGTEAGEALEALFEHVARQAVPVTNEMLVKLEQLSGDRRSFHEQKWKLRDKFSQLFGGIPENPGLTVHAPKGEKGRAAKKALQRFTAEWMQTLQLMRGLQREFAALSLRPTWVDTDANPVVHFDQFLHAYYYDYVRAGGDEEDDESSGLRNVESFFSKHRADPRGALREAARWWASLPADVHGEEEFIRNIAPEMQRLLARSVVREMGLREFTEGVRNVNAFRMHARQIKNAEFGLPADHHESLEARVSRLAAWLWGQRTATGKTVRDILEFVLWGTAPADMEQRLWLAVSNKDYRIPHFGQSALGEAIDWARPEDYPPRNNRTNKALRALGHDVKLFSKA